MSAFEKLRERHGAEPLVVMAASGQLGYGIPEAAFRAGVARGPDFIGCDMGSIDPGPYYLGAGQMASSPVVTRRDLTMVLTAARQLDVPLVLGSAGTAGAAPHLEATLEIVREIAREEGLHFRLASIRADMERSRVRQALEQGRVRPLGAIPELTAAGVEECEQLVGQMGTEAFQRALEGGADVVIAGRACDTAVFAAIPGLLGYDMGLAMQMAKIIECTSICCSPGGRDAILGLLDHEGFVLESMNPERHATPMSVAAHSLYEQSDPFSVIEPEGTLWLDKAVYEAIDEHRVRGKGGRWQAAERLSVKIEGAAREGERAVLLAGSSDPGFIAGLDSILPAVERIVREIVPGTYRFFWRVYGLDGVTPWPAPPEMAPREVFILVECVAEDAAEARGVIGVFKQYLLHHGFPGRMCTGGNLAFPITPSELDARTAYRFNVYHVMETDELAPLFPVEFEEI